MRMSAVRGSDCGRLCVVDSRSFALRSVSWFCTRRVYAARRLESRDALTSTYRPTGGSKQTPHIGTRSRPRVVPATADANERTPKHSGPRAIRLRTERGLHGGSEAEEAKGILIERGPSVGGLSSSTCYLTMGPPQETR